MMTTKNLTPNQKIFRSHRLRGVKFDDNVTIIHFPSINKEEKEHLFWNQKDYRRMREEYILLQLQNRMNTSVSFNPNSSITDDKELTKNPKTTTRTGFFALFLLIVHCMKAFFPILQKLNLAVVTRNPEAVSTMFHQSTLFIYPKNLLVPIIFLLPIVFDPRINNAYVKKL
mmetsp:Transcript_25828/g.29543  ORF Transcript_25828/g.29543 Transcript_25828/m.29543 type:complete len:171 (+) Transcript_25828:120-632(+)